MVGRHGRGLLSIAAALVVAGGCGGSAEYRTGSTGGSGGSASSVGGSGGRSGSTGTGGGGSGGTGAYAAQAGSGGCVAECGVDGAPCCYEGEGCGFGGPNGSMSCNCQAGFWRCTSSFGGIGGAAGFGGSGCIDVNCGPHDAPCCSEGLGCATAGTNYSCSCMRGQWQCTSGSGGTGGSSGTCNVTADCSAGLDCCAGRCVNELNDIYNCGQCGAICAGPYPFCSNGGCSSPPCWSQVPRPAGTFCCGDQTCTDSQLCCEVQRGGPSFGPSCYTPTDAEPSCPVGCPLCL